MGSRSSGREYALQMLFAHEVVTGRYNSGFALALLAKDVSIAASLAAASGLDTPIVGLVSGRLAAARDALPPGADHSSGHQGWWDVTLAQDAEDERAG